MVTTQLLIDSNVLARLTRSTPLYVQEILAEAKFSLSCDASGFVLEIQTQTRNQLKLLLLEEGVSALLQALTQLLRPSVLRLAHKELSRDIPVEDFLNFC